LRDAAAQAGLQNALAAKAKLYPNLSRNRSAERFKTV